MPSADEFYNRATAIMTLVPGIKVGSSQNYVMVWHNKTVFFVHREDSDEIIFTSNNIESGEKEQIEVFFRNHLTNENNVLY